MPRGCWKHGMASCRTCVNVNVRSMMRKRQHLNASRSAHFEIDLHSPQTAILRICRRDRKDDRVIFRLPSGADKRILSRLQAVPSEVWIALDDRAGTLRQVVELCTQSLVEQVHDNTWSRLCDEAFRECA